MSRGHHITHCQYCNKEYMSGDCITSECEFGRTGRKTCEGFATYLRQQAAMAKLGREVAERPDVTGKAKAGGRLMALAALSNIVQAMTNEELTDALITEVWAEMSMGSRESALVDEAIDRIRVISKGEHL